MKDYDLRALNLLELIVEDNKVWISTQQISDVSLREHKNVMRDLQTTLEEVNSAIAELSTDTPNYDLVYNSLKACEIKESSFVDSYGRSQPMYLMNGNVAIMMLLTYSLAVQIKVSQLFFDAVDKYNL